MGSIKAQRMARKVSESIGSNKPVNYQKIAIESGYSPSSAKNVIQITETKSYKTALITENSPLLEGIQAQINRMKIALANKDMNNEETRTLVGSIDLLTKNYQLLSGGATERQVFVLPSQVMNRNEIVATEEKPLLDNGSTEP